ncbi:cyclin-D6-1 [Curcuma longa]|uniref:cyclin-D6-1 n=1 Tax=Curcuma longa TaxID=136217 RepID=UPI003D9F7AFD
MDFDLENPLISCDDEQQRSGSVAALFAAESDHMVSSIGDVAARRDAVALVLQFGCTLDPLVAYLAINYIDRFLRRREIAQEKPWIVRLLSVSCISLASKMKKSGSVLADLRGEGGIVFDAQTVRRMELLVLAALDWRMRSITPFSFLRFFVSFCAPAPAPLLQALKSHATQIILKTQSEVKMLGFKPSVVAAAALLAAAYELFPAQFPTFRAAVYSCEFVNEDELWECSHSMSNLTVDVCDVPASDTPVTVFGRHCSSSENEPVVGSSPDVGREMKKRRFSPGHAACGSGEG